MLGFLNIYKPYGITSHDVISRLRRILHIKRIGHGGTLDPLAEGVLPVAVSNATRLIDFLPQEKEYIAEFQLGVISKSYDTETDLEFFSDKKITESDINDILENFKGEIKQKPPMYSAVKVGGKKLYELAREGESLDVAERTIIVNKIILESFDYQTQKGRLKINCSKGTYIRSIINDMGQILKTGAVMSKLTRTLSGGMTVKKSININDITDSSIVEKNLISISEILPFKQIDINENQLKRVKNGNSFKKEFIDGLVFLKYKEEIIAFGEVSNNIVKIKKVFIQ